MLNVELNYNGDSESPTAKLIVAAYDADGVITDNIKTFNISGTQISDLNYTKPENVKTIRIYIWNDLNIISPLSTSVKLNIE